MISCRIMRTDLDDGNRRNRVVRRMLAMKTKGVAVNASKFFFQERPLYHVPIGVWPRGGSKQAKPFGARSTRRPPLDASLTGTVRTPQ
ncbi:unnamed protein product [Toxocara canis]|uniref:Transposase n=1 Tax=Toxocara canis TaxID=6265 RepID=A0A183U2S3_TOXCA|nr:unnamed protein product [Toxocara canis]